QLSGPGNSLVLLAPSDECRLGGSILAQSYRQLGNETPDVDPIKLKDLFELTQSLVADDTALAIHDRSDGGYFVTCLEMAFASKLGIEMHCQNDWQADLFNEEIGVVLELRTRDVESVLYTASRKNLFSRVIGKTTVGDSVVVKNGSDVLLERSLARLEEIWNSTSHSMQSLRDNEACIQEELEDLLVARTHLVEKLSYDPEDDVVAPLLSTGKKPKVAILRDQGVNGQREMAAAFMRAGFEAVDVHMTDVFTGRTQLSDFQVLAACGGFSYGDVLGGGGGWAKSILHNTRVRDEFESFFHSQVLTLGICNGCQMLSQLTELIPGAEHWPRFVRNKSDQFEGRTVQTLVSNARSPWLEGMSGSIIPVPVAHGEGCAQFNSEERLAKVQAHRLVAAQYVDQNGSQMDTYPWNPNGSPAGIAGLISEGGNALIMMPHPERVFRQLQCTWMRPKDRDREAGAWMRLFRNARKAVG
ncbi:MAG: phosphoribosylformylglycinamidine synthase subunit PurQ, partial [Gammaproteobacteria bacterium]|nr:phosphoribosylformylglycinamidine synthase subunit PurQ [Gammaproteobacteria bacterium]